MTTEPKAEGGCTDVEVLRDILGDHPLPPRQREAVESAIRSLNAKAEGGEAVAGLRAVLCGDASEAMSAMSDGASFAQAWNALDGKAFRVPESHPTPSAVEALARAACDAVIALSTDAVEVEFAQGELRTALAHPEIAALLKETK